MPHLATELYVYCEKCGVIGGGNVKNLKTCPKCGNKIRSLNRTEKGSIEDLL